MLHAISNFLGISHISKTFKGSWKQIRRLRKARENYKNSMVQNDTVHGVNDSGITARMEAGVNIPITATSTDSEIARKQWILHCYAILALTLKEQEERITTAAQERMRNIASTSIVLCAVGFIPSCIASLGNLFDDDSVSAEHEQDQSIVGALLITLGVWCSISILQTIFFYRVIPSLLHHKVLKRLVKGPRKITPMDIYKRDILEQFIDKEEVDPATVDSCWNQYERKKLSKTVVDSTRWMIFFQLVYPLHDLINWMTYPVMLMLQVLVLGFILWLPKNQDYDTSMQGQNMFSVWIFVLNFILSLSGSSPSLTYDDHVDDENNQ